MYPQQQQQQILKSNNQYLFHRYHYYPIQNELLDQAPVYSQLQPFQQYPHQNQHQVNQTYTSNQPINSQQQIVFQPPINQPTERTDDQIRQSKVLKRPDEVLDKNNELITRVELKSD